MSGNAMWLGPFTLEGTASYKRAREAGMSAIRAQVLGVVGSFREGWLFRKTIARWLRCSVRTVQRALTQARELGLLGTARAKKDEIPPGRKEPMPCGWSHRWIIGWGKAGEAVKALVEQARARWIVRHSMPPKPPAARVSESVRSAPPGRPEYQRRSWTASELDAELERMAIRVKPPPD